MEKTALLLFTAIFLLLDFYAFQSIKLLTKKPIFHFLYWFLSISIAFIIVFLAYNVARTPKDTFKVQWILGLIIVFYFPKLFLIIPLLLEDIVRIFVWIFSWFSKEKSYFPSRRKTIGLLALGLASIPFLGSIYGVIKGRFNYRVKNIKLTFKDLPKNFNGFKIVQISDIHIGSFTQNQKDELLNGIDLINKQNADIVLFTGDMVNFIAEEVEDFKEILSQIKGKKYSVLGNHDYGEYAYGRNDKTNIKKNIDTLQALQKEMNFEMLRNQSIRIEKNNEHINIIGVENYGKKGRFPQTGNLDLATQNINNKEFNILMSHDPTHFDEVVKTFNKHIHLTLSGHTHGMQLGVNLSFLKFSPVQFVYKKWAGLYEENQRFLYVNCGFGFLAMPARIGINPEITVFELFSEY